MTRLLSAITCLLLVPSAALSQGIAPVLTPVISGKATPNPAAPGTTVTVTLDTSRPVGLLNSGAPGSNPIGLPPRPCDLSAVRAGTPAGPIVWVPPSCGLAVLVPGGPNPAPSWPGTDQSGNPVAPGLYFFEFFWSDNAGTLGAHYVPVRIDDPAVAPPAPVLAITGTLSPGGFASLDLSSPADAGRPYVLGVSMTTNVGQSPYGIPLALDADAVFALSVPAPSTALFAGLVGTLSGSGTASGAVALPNLAALQGLQIAAQGIVLTAAGPVATTNPVTCPIR